MKNAPPFHIVSALVLGAASQIGQVLILREMLMVFHGNELSMGIILCAWLAWTGAGSWLGARIVQVFDRPLFLLGLCALGCLVFLPVSIFFIRVWRGFFHIPPGAYFSLWEMTMACFLLLGPLCLLLGLQFVLISRIWREREGSADTSGAARTYMVESMGNMLGGLAFTFMLVHFFNSFQTAFMITAFMTVSAGMLLLQSEKERFTEIKYPALMGLFIMIFSVPAFFILEKIDELAWSIQWQHMAPQHELAAVYQSRYGNIAVLKRHDQYSFFQSGHLLFSTAGPETMVPGFEEQEAVVFAHFSMVQHPDPESILLIGGGLRGVLSEIARHPVKKIDYIEIDPVLTRAAREHASPATLKALEDPRVRLVHTDARLYVKKAADKYDMIIVDAPDPATAVFNRYYTREFFQEAGQALNPGGVFVTGLVSTPDLRGKAVINRNAAVYHTMSSVFKMVIPAGDRFLFYFASHDPDRLSADPDVLGRRYEERGIEAQGFSGLHYHILLEDSLLRRVNWAIRNHGRSPGSHLEGPLALPVVPGSLEEQEDARGDLPGVQKAFFINSDFKPIGYYYTLMFWDEITRSGQRNTLALPLRVSPWWIGILFIIPVIFLAGMRLRRGKKGSPASVRHAVLFTAFTTGFTTMTLLVALLFSFQSIYGFIYETVGLITATFMLGLGLGAFTAQSKIRHKTDLKTLSLVQLIMAAAALLMAIFLPLAAGLKSPELIFAVFAGLTFCAGFINGIDFPLTTACYMAGGHQAERSAGSIYGMELLGACLGAVLAGAVVVPVMGVPACCVLGSVACAAAAAGLMICRGPRSPGQENVQTEIPTGPEGLKLEDL